MKRKQRNRFIIQFILSVFIFLFTFAQPNHLFAQTEDQGKKDLQNQIQEYQKKLDSLRQQKNTLSSQIQFMDTQIYLTGLKIQTAEENILKTQNEIEILDSRIDGLDNSLSYLSKLLLERVTDGYKQRRISFFDIFLNTSTADDLLNQYKYKKTAQNNNQKLLIQVQQAKLNFEEQKKLRENKKIQLDTLKKDLADEQVNLANQKVAKQKLLSQTNNDEKIYQTLLEQARAEYAGIQEVIAGAGTETKIGDVKKGDTIASIIPGASCNSGGAHTHFIVKENGSVTNPFNYLKSVSFNNCSGSSCGSGDGDSFSPSGSWDWPLNPSIELEQGYGSTWAVRNTWVGRIYSFHNGIDINGASNEVQAVSDGTLYKGAYSVGCALSYVKLVHKDSNIETYYLHVYSK